MGCIRLEYYENFEPKRNNFLGELTTGGSKKNARSAYFYGFQGQEKDDEIKGAGNSVNYTYRMHDPRLGRFLSIDPLSSGFPFYSPYQFAGNMPISAIDLEGLEIYYAADGSYIGTWGSNSNIRIISMEKLESFKKDYSQAQNKNNVAQRAAMDCYWSGNSNSSPLAKAYENKTIQVEGVGRIMDHIYSSKTVNGNLLNLKLRKITLLSNGKSCRGYNWEYDNTLSSDEIFTATIYHRQVDAHGFTIDGAHIAFNLNHLVDNYYDIAMTLYHENLHLTKGDVFSGGPWGEFATHFEVAQHSDYSKSSYSYRRGNLEAMDDYLQKQESQCNRYPERKDLQKKFEANKVKFESERKKFNESCKEGEKKYGE